MGDGTRLAVAILIMFIAMIAFFFAFHPSGVEIGGQAVSNPTDILKWMFGQWNDTVTGTTGSNGNTPQGDAGGNTSTPTTGIAPGTSHIGVQGGA